MPDTREKLIELLLASFEKCYSTICVRGDRRCKEYNEDERTTDRSCQARLFADHLIDNGVTVQGWISVKDRLPEDEKKVLCILDDGFFCILEWKSWDWLWDDGHNVYAEKDVTHWMPLPGPPKGE